MKKNYFLKTILAFCLLLTSYLEAQTIWTGTTTTFTKANSADWTLANNQDELTSNVTLTRQNNMSIYNVSQESAATTSCLFNPADTEWAFGTTANLGTLTFGGFMDTNECNPPTIVNQNMVLHLITDNIYIDIKFTSWSSGGSGGGFSYERSTEQSLGINEIELENTIKLFPNPSTEFIKVSGLTENESFTIFNILGAEIKSGIISNNEQIEIRNLKNGLYFLKFINGNIIKFIKK